MVIMVNREHPAEPGLPTVAPAEDNIQVIQRRAVPGAFERLIKPPDMADPERRRVARLLQIILLILISGTLLGFLAAINHANAGLVIAGLSTMLLVEAASFAFLHLKREKLAALILVSGLWILFIGIAAISEGVANSATFGLILVITIAGLTLGGGASLVFAVISGLAGFGLLLGKQSGLIPEGMITFEPYSFWTLAAVILLAAAGMIQLATVGLREAIQRAKENEQSQERANLELQQIRSTLEEQVQSRTGELQNRSKYLQATIDVSRAASSILDSNELMQSVVELIRLQFDLYYVGLFLLDPGDEWAILRAGTGEAGQAMLKRGHRIQYGTGMVGWSIANAQPRITLAERTRDEQIAEIASSLAMTSDRKHPKDPVRLATPELPDTRSEAAFPLRVRGKVIGALTVQSVEFDAFGEIEISTFQSLADQIAISLENARLFSETQLALEEAQFASQRLTSEAWKTYLKGPIDLNFRYENGKITATPNPGNSDLVERKDVLSLPITVRENVIGTVRLTKGRPGAESDGAITQAEQAGWTEEDITMLTTVIEQLGVAMDSARLYEETHRRAERERMTSEIISKIRLSNDPQTILQTAALELRKALGADHAQLVIKTTSQVDRADDIARRAAIPTEDQRE